MLVSCNENNWNLLNLCEDLTNWSVVSFFQRSKPSFSGRAEVQLRGEKQKNVHVSVCCGLADGQISHIRPEARNSSTPWGKEVLFIREWENKSSLQAPLHLPLSFSWPPLPPQAARATSLQNTTVVCSTLNCHSPSQACPEWASTWSYLELDRMWMKLPDVTSGGSVGWRSLLQ